MATRITLRVLGATLAPYSNGAPAFVNVGSISEDWHVDVSQLQRGVDTTPAQRGLYPNAQSSLVIKFVDANHFNTATIYVTDTAAGVDQKANN